MPRKRRAYHHGDLRTALLEAAIGLVTRDGAAAFSLREAARQVGVDAAACYRHFRDRQEVLVALAQQGFGRLAERFERDRLEHAKQGPNAVARAFGRSYLQQALEQPAVFRIMFGDSGFSARDPRLRPAGLQRSAYELLVETAHDYVARHRRKGDPAQLAQVWWATAHGVTRLMIDGALPLSEAEAFALLDRSLDAVLA